MTTPRHSHHTPNGRAPAPLATVRVLEDCGADLYPLLSAHPASPAPVADPAFAADGDNRVGVGAGSAAQLGNERQEETNESEGADE